MTRNSTLKETRWTSLLTAGFVLAALVLVIGPAAAMPLPVGPTINRTISGVGTPQLPHLGSYVPTSHIFVVPPSGGNDTASLQGAFNACTALGPDCTVQLLAGTYHTSQLVVHGFKGSLAGAGTGVTTLQALPNLQTPLVSTGVTNPFWSNPPAPQNAWPVLVTFYGGTISISDLTFSEPNAAPFPAYYVPALGTTTHALAGMVYVVGDNTVAHIDRVAVRGAFGDYLGMNVIDGIHYLGSALAGAWSGPPAVLTPAAGLFALTSSSFSSVAYPTGVQYGVLSPVTICYNTIDTAVAAVTVSDVSAAQLTVCNNHVTNVRGGAAVQVTQGTKLANLTASTVNIHDNVFEVGNGANGIAAIDHGTPPTLSLVASRNVILTSSPQGYDPLNPAASSAVVAIGLVSLVVEGNTIVGGGGAGIYAGGSPGTIVGNSIRWAHDGIWVDHTTAVNVLTNTIESSLGRGIVVVSLSNRVQVGWNTVVSSGWFDLYWDLTGYGNVWSGNQAVTANPPSLVG